MWLLLSGCVWISADEGGPDIPAGFDEDQDGAPFLSDDPAEADCDDEDATRSTRIVEDQCADRLGRLVAPDDACVALAYNGNDDDCDLHDWVDIDGDGVPAMLLADYNAANPDALFAWPSDRVNPVTEVAGLDCYDFDAAIRPGAPDEPADGVDSDCDGLD